MELETEMMAIWLLQRPKSWRKLFGSVWTEMVRFVGLRAGDWTRALESDWEAHQARAAARLNVVVVAALERRPGGDRVFGEGEKLGRGGEMGRVA